MNWKLIWDKFNNWYESQKTEPSWEDQKKKIEELVERCLSNDT